MEVRLEHKIETGVIEGFKELRYGYIVHHLWQVAGASST